MWIVNKVPKFPRSRQHIVTLCFNPDDFTKAMVWMEVNITRQDGDSESLETRLIEAQRIAKFLNEAKMTP